MNIFSKIERQVESRTLQGTSTHDGVSAYWKVIYENS